MKYPTDIVDSPIHEPGSDYNFSEGAYFPPQFKIVGFAFIIVGIALCISSCNTTPPTAKVENPEQSGYSDTLFPFVINLLKHELQYKNLSDLYYSFTYIHFDSIGGHSMEKSPFLNYFHDSLDAPNTDRAIIISIFGPNIYKDYKKLNHEININAFPQFQFITSDSIMSEYKDPYMEYYSFSLPLISNNKNYILIEMDIHGLGVGRGITFIFSKKNEKWCLFKRIGRWIS